MATANAGSLHIDLSMATARLKKGTLKATSLVKKYRRNAVRDLGKVRRAVTGLAAKFIALAGVGGLGLLIKSSFKSVDALAKTADKLGVTTEALAGLRHAASITGVEQGVFDKGLQNMVRTLRDANNGLATYKRSYDELGVDVKKLQALSPEEQFAEIAGALKNVTGNTRKLGIAYDIFGGRATALINTLDLGKDGIKALVEEAQLFGLAISRVEAKKIENANDAFTRVAAVIKGASNAIAAELAPWLEHIAKQFINSAKEAGGMGAKVKEVMGNIVSFIVPVSKAIDILNIGWNTMKTSVLLVATGIARVASFLGSDLGTQMAMDFEVAATTSAMKVQDLVTAIGQGGEKVKQTLKGITAAADEASKKDVLGVAGDKAGGIGGNKNALEFAEAVTHGESMVELFKANDAIRIENAKIAADEIKSINDNIAASFSVGMGNAVADVIVENAKLADVLKNVLKSVVKQIIGSYVTLAVKRAFFSTQATAQAIVEAQVLGVSWATPAALASTATLGGAAAAGSAALTLAVANAQGLAAATKVQARERGGPVRAGQAYVVGEKRAELFVPGSSGTIVPEVNGKGGDVHIHLESPEPDNVLEFLNRNRSKLGNIVTDWMNEEGFRFAT